MKNTVMILLVPVLLLVSNCSKPDAESVEPIEYIPTPGMTAVAVSPAIGIFPNDIYYRRSDAVRHTIEIFPNEIYFGDTIYLIAYGENISTETVKNFPYSIWYEYTSGDFTLTSTMSQNKYHWIPEFAWTVSGCSDVEYRDLQPGEKRPYRMHYLEFPPLEDWDTPFWTEVREKLTQDGVKLELRMMESWFDLALSISNKRGEYSSVETTLEILIKPRPESEMALLEQWFKSTPEKLFPKVDLYSKVPHDSSLKSSGQSDIVLNGTRYDPWLFIRLGNRKPSDPNNPTTLDGWRKLEASLVPSTMRDEVRLTRLQLEYYSAKKGEASENTKNELVEWLQSLPEIQRNFFLGFLVGTMYNIAHSRDNPEKPTPLSDKNRELIRAIYDMLDPTLQAGVCDSMSMYYNDRSLTPPEDHKVFRPFMEIVEPTAEDLALNSKELPDGFRIWDGDSAIGPWRMVAKFVELKENEDTAVLRNRDGQGFNLDFSALSEEDKQYAREQHEKKLAEDGDE